MKLLIALVLATWLTASVATAAPQDGGEITLLTASPSLGNVVNFDFEVSARVKECPDGGTNKCARIQVVCEQAGQIVYAEALPATHTTDFTLGGGSSPWLTSGGPADCVATVYYWIWHPQQEFVPLDSVSFTAGG